MTTDSLPARWVLLASVGLASLFSGLALHFSPDGTVPNLFVPVLLGVGLPPVVALGAGGVRWWQRVGVDLWLDRGRARAQELANKAHALQLKAAEAIIATDDDEQLDTADLPRLERQRDQEIAHWHVFHRRLVAAGCALGWTRDNLTAGPVKVLTQPGWNVGTNNLQAAGYLFKDGAGSRLLVSEADWNAGRLWEKVPCPEGEPPDILPPPYHSATTRQNNGQTAAGAVVEGVAREVGK